MEQMFPEECENWSIKMWDEAIMIRLYPMRELVEYGGLILPEDGVWTMLQYLYVSHALNVPDSNCQEPLVHDVLPASIGTLV